MVSGKRFKMAKTKIGKKRGIEGMEINGVNELGSITPIQAMNMKLEELMIRYQELNSKLEYTELTFDESSDYITLWKEIQFRQFRT